MGRSLWPASTYMRPKEEFLIKNFYFYKYISFDALWIENGGISLFCKFRVLPITERYASLAKMARSDFVARRFRQLAGDER
jgi:hypothetical protein